MCIRHVLLGAMTWAAACAPKTGAVATYERGDPEAFAYLGGLVVPVGSRLQDVVEGAPLVATMAPFLVARPAETEAGLRTIVEQHDIAALLVTATELELGYGEDLRIYSIVDPLTGGFLAISASDGGLSLGSTWADHDPVVQQAASKLAAQLSGDGCADLELFGPQLIRRWGEVPQGALVELEAELVELRAALPEVCARVAAMTGPPTQARVDDLALVAIDSQLRVAGMLPAELEYLGDGRWGFSLEPELHPLPGAEPPAR